MTNLISLEIGFDSYKITDIGIKNLYNITNLIIESTKITDYILYDNIIEELRI
jgi:hypothetical protein